MIARFLIITFGLGWGALLPFFLLPADVLRSAPWLLALPGPAALAPALAAVLVEHRVRGREAAGSLLLALLPRAGFLAWLLPACLGPLLLAAATTGWLVWMGVTPGPVQLDALATFAPFLAHAFLLGSGLGGELGWRGLALPRLQRSLHPVAASLLLGVIVAAWRWPLLQVQSPGAPGSAWPILLAGSLALSVVLTWTYNRSGGSVLVCALLQAAASASPAACERAFPLLWTDGTAATPFAGALGLVALWLITSTRGRLGRVPESPRERRASGPPSRPATPPR